MLFSKQTPAAGGDAFAQFDAAWCYNGNGYIFNDTGTSLDVRIGDSGSVQTVAAGKTLPIALVFSMAELYVRRTDQSPTQVTVEATVGLNAGAADGGGGGTSGPVAAADITDAGTSGRAVLQAETQAEARAAAGVGLAPTPVQRTALSGTQVVLTEASAQAQVFTLTANTTVKLPATGANTWAFAIFHGGGAFTLSINKANDTLLAALTAGDASTVVWDGTALGAY